MKKILLSLSLLALTCGASFAQTAKTAPVMQATKNAPMTHKTMAEYQAEGKAETDKMDKELGLSADQKAKLNNINLKMAIINDRAKQGNSEVALKHYAENKDKMYQQILTPEQYKKYTTLHHTTSK